MPSNVLIVEDNAGTSRLLQMMLAREGFQAETAGSVTQAKAKLFEAVLALIIDCTLGDERGVDLLRDVREGKTAVLPQTVIIMVSGNEKYRLESEQLGATFLLKPYPLVELSGTLQHLLAVAEENN